LIDAAIEERIVSFVIAEPNDLDGDLSDKLRKRFGPIGPRIFYPSGRPSLFAFTGGRPARRPGSSAAERCGARDFEGRQFDGVERGLRARP